MNWHKSRPHEAGGQIVAHDEVELQQVDAEMQEPTERFGRWPKLQHCVDRNEGYIDDDEEGEEGTPVDEAPGRTEHGEGEVWHSGAASELEREREMERDDEETGLLKVVRQMVEFHTLQHFFKKKIFQRKSMPGKRYKKDK